MLPGQTIGLLTEDNNNIKSSLVDSKHSPQDKSANYGSNKLLSEPLVSDKDLGDFKLSGEMVRIKEAKNFPLFIVCERV